MLAPWDAIITDKVENPNNDNSGLSVIEVSRCNVSGFWGALFWDLLNSNSCPLGLRFVGKFNAIKASAQLNSISEITEKIYKIIFRTPFDNLRLEKYT